MELLTDSLLYVVLERDTVVSSVNGYEIRLGLIIAMPVLGGKETDNIMGREKMEISFPMSELFRREGDTERERAELTNQLDSLLC